MIWDRRSHEVGIRLVAGCAAWYLFSALVTFVHEPAHAGAALRLARYPVEVWLGQAAGNARRRLSGGRFTVFLGRVPFGVGWLGSFRFVLPDDAPPVGRGRQLEIVAAGPLASGLLLLAAVAAVAAAPNDVIPVRYGLMELAGGAALSFAATVIPMRYPAWWGGYAGWLSDDLQMWRIVVGRDIATDDSAAADRRPMRNEA